MTQKLAFLLLSLIILSAAAFAVPTATLSALPTSGHCPLQVTFTGNCTDDNAATPIAGCRINLGDGNTLDFNALSNPHTYYCATYNAVLTAMNSAGQTHTATVQINATNQAPTATLNASTNSGLAPLAVTFTGFCSDQDGNADIASCKIDFGDGNSNIDFSSITNPHTYYAANTYTVVLKATDKQGATGQDAESVTVTVPAAPSINSKRPSGYTSTVRPTVNFDVNDSGSGVNISSLVLFVDDVLVSPTTTLMGTNYHVAWAFGSDLANEKQVKVGLRVKDNVGTSTGDVNWSFTVDTGAPTSTSISFGDSWTNDETPSFSLSASDALSGMGSGAQMKFSCNNSGWSEAMAYATSYSSFNITTGPGCNDDEGEKTIYVKFKDAAGNWTSDPASEEVNYDNSNPDTPTGLSTSSRDESVILTWDEAEDNGPAGIDFYKIYVDGTYKTSTTSLTKTVTGLDNGSTYGFRVSAVDNAGNEGSKSSEVRETPEANGDGGGNDGTDDTPPELFWELPGNNKTVKGIVTLKVQSYDDESNVRLVQFRVDDNPIETDSSASGERYSVEWDSRTVVDGEHILKAIAKNRSGTDEDTTTKTIRVTTDNGITSLVPADENAEKAEAEEAIGAAEDAKEEAEAAFAGLQAIGIEPDEAAAEKLSEASRLLEEARNLLKKEKFSEAKDRASEAEELFSGLAGEVSVKDYGEAKEYVYNSEHLALLLQGAGFGQQAIDEAAEVMQNCEVKRSLLVKKVENSETYYKALIVVSVKNDSGEAVDLKLIEVVPKEFAESASEIAGEDFWVVVEDPVLRWNLDLEPGEEKEIVYALKGDLTQEEADSLLESNVINKFAAPPVLVKAGTEVNSGTFSAASAGFFGLGDLSGLAGWAVALVVLIAAALIVVNYLGKRGGESQLSLSASGSTGSELLGRVRGLGRKAPEEKRPRWGYRG